MARFVGAFRARMSHRTATRLDAMATFIDAFDRRRREGFASGDSAFNLFSVLGLDSDEVKHSKVLAWLLEATAEHGAGDAFARAFLAAAAIELPTDALRRYRVATEYVVLEARTDIVLCRRGNFAIYIENKVYAAEGADQVDREYRDMVRLGSALRVPSDRLFAVFLTPDGRLPTSGDATRWRPLAYSSLHHAFSEILPRVPSDKARLVVQDWLEAITRFGGSDVEASAL